MRPNIDPLHDPLYLALVGNEKDTYCVSGPWGLATVKHGYYQCAFGYDVPKRIHASFETIAKFVAETSDVGFPVNETLSINGMDIRFDPFIPFGEIHIINPEAISIKNHHCIVRFDENLTEQKQETWSGQ